MPPNETQAQTRTDSWSRERLSNLYGLFAISMMMFDDRDDDDIVHLAATSVPSLCACDTEAVYLVDGTRLIRCGGDAPDDELEAQLRRLTGDSGGIVLSDGAWRWGFALHGIGGPTGYLVVRAATAPSRDEFFLLNALSQQTAAALANATLLRRQRAQAGELRRLNAQLAESLAQSRRQTAVHDALTAIATTGGESGIAEAVHQLTALPVAVEDRFGNLRAWGGPDRPDPYPKPAAHRRAEMLRRAVRVPHPVRHRDRMISLVKPRHEVLGVLALIDPDRTVGQHELFVLEYGTTVLALELAHQHAIAEVELRLRRDLVDDLVAGTDDESAYARADALGHDLRNPHHVVAVRWDGAHTDDAVAAAAARAATALALDALVSRRSCAVVLVVADRPDAVAVHRMLAESLGGTGAIGVGGQCDTPGDFPRSCAEALRALAIRHGSRRPDGVTVFDQMGIYRVLDAGANRGEVLEFVREWLGPLLDYDEQRNADLVRTLSYYLECGGNYDETAAALTIHRSTLRYRLGRIREITELDLSDVDNRLNLHVATRALQVLDGRNET